MKKAAVAIALLLAALALVACGGSSSDTTEANPETGSASESAGEEGGSSAGEEGGGAALKFEADPGGNLAYTSTSASSEAGEVTVDFNNPQSVPHNVAIEDSAGEVIGETEVLAEGESSAVVSLEPGQYTFFCAVPGHREAGMEGTLTVK